MTELVLSNNVNLPSAVDALAGDRYEGVTRRLVTSDRPIMMSNGIVHYAGHFALPIGPTRLFVACIAVGFANEFCTMPTAKFVREINNLVAGQGRILTICCRTTL
jgi:hypothetical protein